MFGFGKKSGPKLGLDINSSTISILQIEKNKTDLQVTKFSSMPTPPDIVREGLLSDPEAVGLAVRELLDLVGVSNKKPVPIVNVSIPGQAVVIRLMPVPTGMPPEELADVVQQEAINNLPFPLDEANIDYCLLPATERTDPDGVRRVDVLLAGIQRIVIDSYWRMAEAANVQLGRLEISSLAVIRALAASGMLADDGQMTMSVNIRNDATDITLIKKGMPLFSRSVLLGVETLGEAISRSIDAPVDEALAMLPKIQLGSLPTSDPRAGQAAQVARSVFGDLTAEVGRSLEFYMSQVGSFQIDQVILSGQGCAVPGIHEFFSNRLNIATTLADPFQNLIYDKAQILDERKAIYSMLLGLVTDGTSGQVKSVELNLNNSGRSAAVLQEGSLEDGEEEEQEVDTPWFIPVLGGGIAVIVLTLAVWAALAFHFTSSKSSELSELEGQITDAKTQVKEMEKEQGDLAGLREKKNAIERIVRHGEPRSLVLRVLENAVPPGVQVVNITLSNQTLTLSGVSVDFARASHFAINLQGSNMLEDVKLSNVRRFKRAPEQIGFVINANVTPDAAAVDPDEYKLPPPPADEVAADSASGGEFGLATANGGGLPVRGQLKPQIYYFYSPKNPICKAFSPQYESIRKKYDKQADFNTVDFDSESNAEMVVKYQVKSAPDIVFIDGLGRPRHLHGQSPETAISDALRGEQSSAGNGQSQ